MMCKGRMIWNDLSDFYDFKFNHSQSIRSLKIISYLHKREMCKIPSDWE
jgi:hypothetical protein